MATLSSMELVTPLQGATDVSPATPIVLKLVDGTEDAPLPETVVISVNGVEVWADEEPQNGWNATSEEDGSDFYYRLYPPNGFNYSQLVTIETEFTAAVEYRFTEADTVVVTEAWTLERSSSAPSYLSVFGLTIGAPVYSVIETTLTISG